ncbi:MAG: HAMP domain-containing histidine kinase [Candidatus Pacebacteria bacterium]|nr:HAMP domain-containing histidine kinase [Candidatus Paceibacterota bacterium]
MDVTELKKSPYDRYRYIVLALILFGIMFAWLVATLVVRNQRESLAERAGTIAATINESEIQPLTASEADIGTPAYEDLKQSMQRIKVANQDVRFVYAFVLQGNDIVFLGDSEDPDSEDYSAPGDVYYEATPALRSIFRTKQTVVEGPETDRWGTWVSGLAPVLSADGEDVVAVVGLDVDADDYFIALVSYASIPVLLALIMIVLALGGQRLRKKDEELFATKFRFLSIASHELRSPLAGIAWGAESVLENKSLHEKERTMIALIRDAARYMSETVADILTTSRMEGGASKKLLREVVDVAQLVRDAATTLSLNAAKDDITLRFDRDFPQHLPYPCDKDKMRRIFSNVISNALKYSNPKSEVLISYGRDKDGYVFLVTDHGIGIPEAEQKKIFSTYYRATNAERHVAQGTGMGLYFTKQLVELHGGRMWFESKENEGTTMHVFFPDMKQA